ncbi:hypothetical protein ABE10_00445, partial [Bacillus toyonensis]|nr:hypothetical protein [Bacillus toyonensis]
PGDVGDVLPDRPEVRVDPAPRHLLDDAVGRLDPALDVLDGVVGVVVGELVTQDRDLRLHLAHPELILVQEPLELVPELTGLGERLVQRLVVDGNGTHDADVTHS